MVILYINSCMLGVLKRLLLGCRGMQFCYKHAVPFVGFSRCLTSFLTAVLKIAWLCIDWLAHISAWFPTEMTVLSMCVVRVSASVYQQFGNLPLCYNRPDREAQGLWDIEDTRILWKHVAGYWRGSGSSLQGRGCRELCSQSALETPRGPNLEVFLFHFSQSLLV